MFGLLYSSLCLFAFFFNSILFCWGFFFVGGNDIVTKKTKLKLVNFSKMVDGYEHYHGSRMLNLETGDSPFSFSNRRGDALLQIIAKKDDAYKSVPL